MVTQRAVAALDHVATSRWYGAAERLHGLHATATDATWGFGSGDQVVRGPIVDLLMVSTGRAAGLSNLTVNGVPLLTGRLNDT